jgi:hypothetical protein
MNTHGQQTKIEQSNKKVLLLSLVFGLVTAVIAGIGILTHDSLPAALTVAAVSFIVLCRFCPITSYALGATAPLFFYVGGVFYAVNNPGEKGVDVGPVLSYMFFVATAFSGWYRYRKDTEHLPKEI